jgi:hypothetical protein
LNLRTDHAKESNAKDKVLSVNVGWQLEARTGAQQAVPADGGDSPAKIIVFFASSFFRFTDEFHPAPRPPLTHTVRRFGKIETHHLLILA